MTTASVRFWRLLYNMTYSKFEFIMSPLLVDNASKTNEFSYTITDFANTIRFCTDIILYNISVLCGIGLEREHLGWCFGLSLDIHIGQRENNKTIAKHNSESLQLCLTHLFFWVRVSDKNLKNTKCF